MHDQDLARWPIRTRDKRLPEYPQCHDPKLYFGTTRNSLPRTLLKPELQKIQSGADFHHRPSKRFRAREASLGMIRPTNTLALHHRSIRGQVTLLHQPDRHSGTRQVRALYDWPSRDPKISRRRMWVRPRKQRPARRRRMGRSQSQSSRVRKV
jgi:hypothetical protein